MDTNYDVHYFIKKFEAIPEELWCQGQFVDDNKNCAAGHCGARNDTYRDSLPLEAKALGSLFASSGLSAFSKSNTYKNDPLYYAVAHINDGMAREYQQPTPKQRILAALYDIRAKLAPAVKEERIRTKYVVLEIDSLNR